MNGINIEHDHATYYQHKGTGEIWYRSFYKVLINGFKVAEIFEDLYEEGGTIKGKNDYVLMIDGADEVYGLTLNDDDDMYDSENLEEVKQWLKEKPRTIKKRFKQAVNEALDI